MIREEGNVMSMNASWENAEAIQKLGFIHPQSQTYWYCPPFTYIGTLKQNNIQL